MKARYVLALGLWALHLGGCQAPHDALGDHDRDGWRDCAGREPSAELPCDCDDSNPVIHPDSSTDVSAGISAEVCNGVDDNCDGRTDEVGPNVTFVDVYPDRDADGFGDGGGSTTTCKALPEHVTFAGDCDDNNPEVHPNAGEACNGKDDNCDGATDEGLSFIDLFEDADNDGYGAEGAPASPSCLPDREGDGRSVNARDCDDGRADVNPGEVESCTGDDTDNNCDGSRQDSDDKDEDSVPSCRDCDDADAAITGSGEAQTWYRDEDGDGYGDEGDVATLTGCQNAGWSPRAGDCNDSAATGGAIHPGADELCDGVDNNCDAQIDEGQPLVTWFPDQDADGYGDGAAVNDALKVQCPRPVGYADNDADCNDDPAADGALYHPYAVEACPGLGEEPRDFNCDGVSGEADADGDGASTCSAPGALDPSDCDDGDPQVYPGHEERCDAKDNNCNGLVDDVGLNSWYRDQDGDGYGVADGAKNLTGCDVPGWVMRATGQDTLIDCDDEPDDDAPSSPGARAIHPGAEERCDALDDNCDGILLPDENDLDLDGHLACSEGAPDCDDHNDQISPSATERCDGADNNCDGLVDNEAEGASVYYEDLDGDGYGNSDPLTILSSCEPVPGRVTEGTDCNDSRAEVSPEGQEVCDPFNVDEDCDGLADDQDPTTDGASLLLWYPDADADGYGDDDAVAAPRCDGQAGEVPFAGDCDDTDSATNPLAAEICGDGQDHNCDDYLSDDNQDHDGDGYVPCNDCDDGAPTVYPGAREVCDGSGVDEDCDGRANDDDLEGASATTAWYPDQDGDGFGDRDEGQLSCEAPPGWTDLGGDCADGDAAVYPSAPERCDGVDNNCDGLVDNEPYDGSSWYSDQDGDGFGDPAQGVRVCGAGPVVGHVQNNQDCGPEDEAIHPGAPELCDGADNDCDARIDDGDNDLEGAPRWYVDSDHDGAGSVAQGGIEACEVEGRIPTGGDCNDADPSVHAGAEEVCDGKDNNCDGEIDNNAADATPYYPDEDGDGYGATAGATPSCAPPAGWSGEAGDCNDTDPNTYPDAEELDDGLDNSCDGFTEDGVPVVENMSAYVSADGSSSPDVPTYTSLQAAINDAAEGALIVLGPGRHGGCVVIKDKDVALYGAGGSDGTTLVGCGSSATLTILRSAVQLGGFTVSGGIGVAGATQTADTCGHDTSSSARHGGAICARDSTLAAQDLIFAGNTATYGGELYLRDSSTSLQDVSFSGGTLTCKLGGGFYLRGGALTLEDVEVLGYTGVEQGAGGYVDNGALSMARVDFSNNVASGAGGGLRVKVDQATGEKPMALSLDGVAFLLNSAGAGGGGLYVESNGVVTGAGIHLEGNVVVGASPGGGAYLSITNGGVLELAPSINGDPSVLALGNSTGGHGGGLKVTLAGSAAAHLQALQLTANHAELSGGGLHLESSNPLSKVSGLVLEGNRAGADGGGLYVGSSPIEITGVSALNNRAAAKGGGLFVGGGELSDLLVRGGEAASGGGVATSGAPKLTRLVVEGNKASAQGGGLYLGGGPSLKNVIVHHNEAQGLGGGVAIPATADVQPRIESATLVANRAWQQGGGLYLGYNSRSSVWSTLLAYNAAPDGGSNLANDGAAAMILSDCLVYAPPEDTTSTFGLSSFDLDGLIQGQEPGFIRDPRFGGAGSVDLHLRPSSPGVDVGEVSDDPDGSPSDLGAYGGAASWSTDNDADGLPDDWEVAMGLDPDHAGEDEDKDADSLTNLEEYTQGLNPTLADTDGDGADDDQDPAPLNPFDRDGVGGEIRVPEDAPTVQEAVDRAFSGDTVTVGPGEWVGNTMVQLKALTLRSDQGADSTTLRGDGTQSVLVLYATPAGASVEGLTLTGGVGVLYHNNSDRYGGGLYLGLGQVNLSELTFLNNDATEGGGLYQRSSTSTLSRCTFEGNSGSSSGGGMYQLSGTATLTHCLFEDNSGSYGGGLYQSGGTATLTHCLFEGNSASSYGGGMYQQSGTATLTHCLFDGNSASSYGGGMYQQTGTATLTHCLFQGNSASGYGGGMYQQTGTATLTHCLFQGNSASYGGAILRGATLTLSASILAFNEAPSYPNANLSASESSYSCFWTSSGGHGITSTPSDSNLMVDPKLMPDGAHLEKGSSLIGKGPTTEEDPDGSSSDIGLYGGPGAGGFDLDGDGCFSYFWPGELADAPPGYEAEDWDPDDRDPDVGCP